MVVVIPYFIAIPPPYSFPSISPEGLGRTHDSILHRGDGRLWHASFVVRQHNMTANVKVKSLKSKASTVPARSSKTNSIESQTKQIPNFCMLVNL